MYLFSELLRKQIDLNSKLSIISQIQMWYKFPNIILLKLALKHKRGFNNCEWKPAWNSLPCVRWSIDILEPFHTLLGSFLRCRSWRTENLISRLSLPSSSFRSVNHRPLCDVLAGERKGRGCSGVVGRHVGFGRRPGDSWWLCQHVLETTYFKALGSEAIISGSLRFLLFLISWTLAAVSWTFAQSTLLRVLAISDLPNWTPSLELLFSIFLSNSSLIQLTVPRVKVECPPDFGPGRHFLALLGHHFPIRCDFGPKSWPMQWENQPGSPSCLALLQASQRWFSFLSPPTSRMEPSPGERQSPV